jgi:GTPase SAR1 family protein
MANLEQFLDDSGADSKILFTGLDYAGKSSIILVLKHEFENIATLKPTKAAQRKIFEYIGRSVAEWDLGGQRTYRMNYLLHPSKYFDNTDVCIYVIDIQDKLRVLEMLSYFADVIAQFKKLKITPAINIFLHKYDPEYVENNQIGINALVSELKEKIETIVDKQFDLSFHKTTTKRMWSIINAFSQIMLSLYPQSKLIDKLISDFVNKTEAKAMVILDYNSLVIGQSYTDEYYQELVQISAPYFLTLSDNFSTKLSTLKNQPPDKSKIDLTDGCDEIIEKDECINANKRLTITRSGEKYIFDEFTLLKFKNPMYILMIAGDKEISDEELNSFIKVFKNYI